MDEEKIFILDEKDRVVIDNAIQEVVEFANTKAAADLSNVTEDAITNLGAAAVIHKHNASDLNDIIPIANGGTESTNAKDARAKLEITPANIGAASIPMMVYATLSVDTWDQESLTQVVNIDGIVADYNVQWISVGPAPDSQEIYNEAGIFAMSQGENSLTFKAAQIPTGNCSAYIMIQDVTTQTV